MNLNSIIHHPLFPTLLKLAIDLIKILVIFGAVLSSVPFMVLLERILLARIQHRAGPNRVGPPFLRNTLFGGIAQTMVDGIKLFLKEELTPASADKVIYALAPLLTIVPAIFVLSVIPIGPVIHFTFLGQALVVPLSITDLDIGILFYLAVTGVGVYGIVLAGWSSNSKYSLLGGIRSSAQMLSYEISLGLAIVGVLLIAGSFDLRVLLDRQQGWFWNWNVFKQPVGFALFMIAGFAETNRLPFDLPEGESELGGGFHTEYSSMKFAMFFMSEYMNMFTFSAILTTLFLGGFQAPVPSPFADFGVANAIWGVAWFSLKIFLMVCFMIFIRGTWPRFRYDQLMDLGWKLMLPAALINLMMTATIAVFAPARVAGPLPDGPALTLALFLAGLAQLFLYDRILTARRKRVLRRVA